MNFDFAKIPFEQAYKLVVSTVVPRPVAWVVTKDQDGVVNAAPYSFFNAFSDNPVVVGFGCGPRAPGALKDTVANIEATGQFVVNINRLGGLEQAGGQSGLTEAALSQLIKKDYDSTRKLNPNASYRVLVRADKDLGWEKTKVVLKAAATAGVANVVFATTKGGKG